MCQLLNISWRKIWTWHIVAPRLVTQALWGYWAPWIPVGDINLVINLKSRNGSLKFTFRLNRDKQAQSGRLNSLFWGNGYVLEMIYLAYICVFNEDKEAAFWSIWRWLLRNQIRIGCEDAVIASCCILGTVLHLLPLPLVKVRIKLKTKLLKMLYFWKIEWRCERVDRFSQINNIRFMDLTQLLTLQSNLCSFSLKL